MAQVKSIILGGSLTLVLFLTVGLAVLVASGVQPAQANEVYPPVVTVIEDVQYENLVDAMPQRDITVQRFAPLQGQ